MCVTAFQWLAPGSYLGPWGLNRASSWALQVAVDMDGAAMSTKEGRAGRVVASADPEA